MSAMWKTWTGVAKSSNNNRICSIMRKVTEFGMNKSKVGDVHLIKSRYVNV